MGPPAQYTMDEHGLLASARPRPSGNLSPRERDSLGIEAVHRFRPTAAAAGHSSQGRGPLRLEKQEAGPITPDTRATQVRTRATPQQRSGQAGRSAAAGMTLPARTTVTSSSAEGSSRPRRQTGIRASQRPRYARFHEARDQSCEHHDGCGGAAIRRPLQSVPQGPGIPG